MIKYLIIDDEYIAHDIIKGYCDLLPNMQLMKSCFDALEAFEYLNTNKVDLIFLDLNMPKLKGFEFLRTLSFPPKVIVTTAYKKYAIEGYELQISDYLLKPFSFERFLKAVNNAVGSNNTKQNTNTTEQDNGAQTIFLRSNKKYIQVNISIILFAESAGNYTKVVTLNEIITIREKISDLLEKLPKNDFLKVHKSFIVAKKHIENIEGNRIKVKEHKIPIGTTHKNIINEFLTE